jgi:hypothetical protein
VAELALVKLANRLIETFQKSKARGSDAGFDDAAVVGLSGARDEAALFHAVEKTGHVRVVGNHAFADAAAGEAGRFGAAKNAEDVVLGAGEAVRLEELLAFQAEVVGGFLERDEDTGFDGEGGMGSGAATHGNKIVVITTNVKRKELGGKMAGSGSDA